MTTKNNTLRLKVGDAFSVGSTFDPPIYRLIGKLPNDNLFYVYPADKNGNATQDKPYTRGYDTIDDLLFAYSQGDNMTVEKINKPEVKREWKVGDVFSVVNPAGAIEYRVIIVRRTECVGGNFAALYANEKGQATTVMPAAICDSVKDIIKFYSENNRHYEMGEFICNVNDKAKYKYSADAQFVEEVKCGRQRGIIVGFVVMANGEAFPAVGWSLCHKTDEFDYELGLGLANANAMGWKVTKYDRTCPHPLRKPFEKMKNRMQRIVRKIPA